jgi:hypothetical protein
VTGPFMQMDLIERPSALLNVIALSIVTLHYITLTSTEPAGLMGRISRVGCRSRKRKSERVKELV